MFEHWFTVRYRGLLSWMVLAICAVGVLAALHYRDFFQSSLEESIRETRKPRTNQPAYFSEIRGNVQVKKVGELGWTPASQVSELQPGDLVQTHSGSSARVVFFDGSTSLLRSDSLTSIVESHLTHNEVRAVAVEVSSGSINLETAARDRPQDQARLMTPDAEARLREYTEAQAEYDQRMRQSNFLVSEGAAQVYSRAERADQSVTLRRGETITVREGREWVVQESRSPPAPKLVTPEHYSTFPLSRSRITLEWEPVAGIDSYRLRLTTASTAEPVLDQTVKATRWELPVLEKGIYTWQVDSIDGQGQSSRSGESFKFAVLEELAVRPDLSIGLAIEEISKMGDIYRVKGRTDPGVALLINGEPAVVEGDGSFHHFTRRLSRDTTHLEVRAQDLSGLARTERVPLPN